MDAQSAARQLVHAFHQLDRERRIKILRSLHLVPKDGHVPDGDGREFRAWCATAFNRAQRGFRPDGDGMIECGSLKDLGRCVRHAHRRDREGRDVGVFAG